MNPIAPAIETDIAVETATTLSTESIVRPALIP
jgi:hypothetical protein